MKVNLWRKQNTYTSSSLSKLAWHRFRKNLLAMSALIFILLVSLISILGYWITPDKKTFANTQILQLKTKKPGFSVEMLKIKQNKPSEKKNAIKRMASGSESTYRYIPIVAYHFEGNDIIYEEYTGMTPNNGMVHRTNLLDICNAIQDNTIESNGSFLSGMDIEGKTIEIEKEKLTEIIQEDFIYTKSYLLGTDRFGRDLLSRLILGSRISISVGFIAVFISLIIGITLGASAGYFGGKIDNLIVWFINVVWSIPTLLLVIAITMALGKGFWQVFIAVGLTMWVEVARVVRGQVMSLRKKEFVEAGEVLGFSHSRIIFKHILPNVMSPLIVISAANFASAILIEAGLSFLGIGVQPPMPSWGGMIKEHYAYIVLDYAYLAIVPGLAIMLLVLSFMIIGNGLRDALDVKVVKE